MRLLGDRPGERGVGATRARPHARWAGRRAGSTDRSKRLAAPASQGASFGSARRAQPPSDSRPRPPPPRPHPPPPNLAPPCPSSLPPRPSPRRVPRAGRRARGTATYSVSAAPFAGLAARIAVPSGPVSSGKSLSKISSTSIAAGRGGPWASSRRLRSIAKRVGATIEFGQLQLKADFAPRRSAFWGERQFCRHDGRITY